MRLTVAEIAKLLGAHGIFQENEILGLAIDSRNVKPEEIFFAIKGERSDGHDYAKMAKDNGSVLLVGERFMDAELPQIIVQSTEEAMIKIGHYYLSKFHPDTIGITGSAGKTTTKELTASMLATRYKVAKNDGNHNTPIGIPMIVKNVTESTEIFVCEMSGSFMDEIPKILQITIPRIGIVTNVGYSHLETLGGIEGVAKSKSQLIKNLPVGGIAILNADDDNIMAMRKLTRCQLKTFGINKEADVSGNLIDGRVSIKSKGDIFTFQPIIPTIHFLYDVLASAACALEYGISLREAIDVAEAFKPVAGRGVIITNEAGINIIDESYNANPVSMRETLKMLSQRPGRKFAVLADMLQLGEDSEHLHNELGEFVASLRLDGVFCFGTLSRRIASSSSSQRALHFESKKALIEALKSRLQKDDWVLVKGSNGMGMKEVVDSLEAQTQKEEK